MIYTNSNSKANSKDSKSPALQLYKWPLFGLLVCAVSFVYAQSKPTDFSGNLPVAKSPADAKPQAPSIKSKLPHQLLEAVDEYLSGNSDWAKAVGIPPDYVFGDKILVDIFAEESQLSTSLPDLITRFGGEMRGELTKTEFEATVPVKALLYLAQDSSVKRITFAVRQQLLFHTQGVNAANIRNWAFPPGLVGHGLLGDGVKIAIIDSIDFGLLARQQSTGSAEAEAPPAARVSQFTIMGGEATARSHGNNVLEIIYDFAPAADYILINTALSNAAVRQAFDVAIAQHANVINLSLGGLSDSDGSAPPGTVAEKVREAYRAGITTIVSAANQGQSHWGGRFRSLPSNPNTLDWNFNQLDGGGRVINSSGPQDINIVKYGEQDCAPNGIPLFIVAQREIGTWADPAWGVRLVRQGSTGRWYTVNYSGGSPESPLSTLVLVDTTNSAAPNYGEEGPITRTAESIGNSPGCPAGSARYGMKILRDLERSPVGTGRTLSNGSYFVNIHSSFQLRYPVPQSSMAAQATIPEAFSVGAAVCTTNASSVSDDCDDLSIADYSSRGPVLGPLNSFPVFRTSSALRDEIFDVGTSVLKPDAVSITNVRTSLTRGLGFTGTSASAPHVTGMTALLLQRYPNLRGDPYTTKVALSQIAAAHDNRDTDLVRAGYTPDPSYDYGRGLLRFQVEDHLEFRGRPNNARVGEVISSTPSSAAPDGSVHFTDGYDDTLRVRFKDRFDRPIVFPGLVPQIQLAGGAPDASTSDLAGGDALVYDAGRYYLIGDLYMGFTSGYYDFPGLRITRLAPSVGMDGTWPPYHLELEARTVDGVPMPYIPVSRSADFDLSR